MDEMQARSPRLWRPHRFCDAPAPHPRRIVSAPAPHPRCTHAASTAPTLHPRCTHTAPALQCTASALYPRRFALLAGGANLRGWSQSHARRRSVGSQGDGRGRVGPRSWSEMKGACPRWPRHRISPPGFPEGLQGAPFHPGAQPWSPRSPRSPRGRHAARHRVPSRRGPPTFNRPGLDRIRRVASEQDGPRRLHASAGPLQPGGGPLQQLT